MAALMCRVLSDITLLGVGLAYVVLGSFAPVGVPLLPGELFLMFLTCFLRCGKTLLLDFGKIIVNAIAGCQGNRNPTVTP